MSRTLLAAALVTSAALSAAVAADLRAQQAPAPRFVASAPAAESRVTPGMALDSAARYERTARGQRASGAALGALGAGGMGAAYAAWMRDGRMGMSGGQAAAMSVGVVAVAVAWDRWRDARESDARARRWSEQAGGLARP